MLALSSQMEYEALEKDRWGIPSLQGSSVAERENWTGSIGLMETSDIEALESPLEGSLDVVVMPGMAFDKYCNRLGHGRGYYDKFLGEMQGSLLKGIISQMPALSRLLYCQRYIEDDSDLLTGELS